MLRRRPRATGFTGDSTYVFDERRTMTRRSARSSSGWSGCRSCGRSARASAWRPEKVCVAGARGDRRRRGLGRVRRRHRAPATPRSSTRASGCVLRDSSRRRCFAAGDVATDVVDRVFACVRGNPMAKATLIDAFLDAELRATRRVPGRDPRRRPDRVRVRRLGRHRARRPTSCWSRWTATSPTGYRRIKLKIEPGLDVERVGRGPRRASRHRRSPSTRTPRTRSRTSTSSARWTTSTCS